MPDQPLIPIKRQRNWAWIWLGYTGFLFIAPLIEPSLRVWLGTIAVFAIFIGIFAGYVRATDQGHPTRYWMIAATFVLGLITLPWNPGASTFFVYAASFLPFAIPSIRRVFALFATESIIILLETYLFQTRHHGLHIYWPNSLIAVFMIFVIGGGQIFFAEQKRADCKLRAAQEENIALAAVAERERIARDLHDVLGHTLSVIVLKAELAGRLLSHPDNPNPNRAATEIADVERTARTALSEVREAIGGYRARGLAAEIEAARRTLDAAGVTLINESETSVSAGLTANEETVLALALREAVTNIVRHASATTCRLRFIHQDGRRRLVVQDNGQNAVLREGNGLRGMRERVESLGGRLILETVPDMHAEVSADHQGTDRGIRLSIDLPLQSGAS
jgi:two-component system sensor histidine kinase DesK